MDPHKKDSDEIWPGVKLVARSFALFAVASLLWHVPVDEAVFSWILKAIALAVFVLSALGIILSAAVWRNLFWRCTLGRFYAWRGGRIGNLLLGLPFLLVLCLIAVLIFMCIGRLIP